MDIENKLYYGLKQAVDDLVTATRNKKECCDKIQKDPFSQDLQVKCLGYGVCILRAEEEIIDISKEIVGDTS